jgi:hypothetical protein
MLSSSRVLRVIATGYCRNFSNERKKNNLQNKIKSQTFKGRTRRRERMFLLLLLRFALLLAMKVDRKERKKANDTDSPNNLNAKWTNR